VLPTKVAEGERQGHQTDRDGEPPEIFLLVEKGSELFPTRGDQPSKDADGGNVLKDREQGFRIHDR